MTPHLACPVHESSQIGEARRQAARVATVLGFDALAQGRLALMVTELGTNLVRHAKDGLLLIGVYAQAEVTTIEVISVVAVSLKNDVERSLADGVSAAGTPGTGLGAIKRLASQFIIFSKADVGTVIVARLAADASAASAATHRDAPLSYAGISLAAPGETISGDSWACRRSGASASLVMADGLGHGPLAAEAADTAIQVFMTKSTDCRDTVESCHAALRSTRGAALAAMDIDPAARCVDHCGVGNISTRIISGVGDRTLLSQHGTLGLQMRKVQTVRYELPAHALLVAHSDGLTTRWDLRDVPEILSCDPIVVAAYLLRHHVRGRDDATVVVARCY